MLSSHEQGLNRSKVQAVVRIRKAGSHFKHIPWLMKLAMIFPMAERGECLTAKGLLWTVCLELGIGLFHLYWNYTVLRKLHYAPLVVANAFMTVICVLHRLAFRRRRGRIAALLTKMASRGRHLQDSGGVRRCLACWSTCTCVAASLIVVASFFSLEAANEKLKTLDLGEGFAQRLAKVFYAFSLIFLLVCPTFVFAQLYCCACSFFRSCLEAVGADMDAASSDVSRTLRRLTAVALEIHRANDLLGTLVFLGVAFNGAVMYFAVTMFTHPESYPDLGTRISLYVLFAYSFGGMVALFRFATAVNDSFAELSVRCKLLPSGIGCSSVVDQLRFHLSLRDEISMTAWGLGPIRWNLFLALIGTVFTYCLLVDGLRSAAAGQQMG